MAIVYNSAEFGFFYQQVASVINLLAILSKESFGLNVTPSGQFMHKTKLSYHIFIVENYTVPESKKKPYCVPCQQGFKYQWSYDKHVRAVHEGIRDVQCAECGKFFLEQQVWQFWSHSF